MKHKRESWSKWQRGAVSASAIGLIGVPAVMGAFGAGMVNNLDSTDKARAQGEMMRHINGAVGAYLAIYYGDLMKLPDGCSRVALQVGESPKASDDVVKGNCKLKLPGEPVVASKTGSNGASMPSAAPPADIVLAQNGLQPTIAELKALGVLDAGTSEVPILNTTTDPNLAVRLPDDDNKIRLAPNSYSIVIEKICISDNPTQPVVIGMPCSASAADLRSLVFNTQPFVYTVADHDSILRAAGGDAAASGPVDKDASSQNSHQNPTGRFLSLGEGWSQANPILQKYEDKTKTGPGGEKVYYYRGADNLVALRNGYASAAWGQFVRRDGAVKPTANWDFNGKDLLNVGNLEVKSLKVSGDIKTDGDISGKNASFDGSVDVKEGLTVRGILNAMQNLIVGGTTELKGALLVASNALFKSDVQIEGKLTGTSASFSGQVDAAALSVVGNISGASLKIGSTTIDANGLKIGVGGAASVSDGQACSGDHALAQASDGSLMVCTNWVWKPMAQGPFTNIGGNGGGCKPEGAGGRLPDGTLAVCSNGIWVSALLGAVSEGSNCSVPGSLASGRKNNLAVLAVCSVDNKWSMDIYARPMIYQASEGNDCPSDGLMAESVQEKNKVLICDRETRKWTAAKSSASNTVAYQWADNGPTVSTPYRCDEWHYPWITSLDSQNTGKDTPPEFNSYCENGFYKVWIYKQKGGINGAYFAFLKK